MATTPTIQAPRRLSPARMLALGTVLAVIVAGILIGVSVAGSSSSSNAVALSGAGQTALLLDGIPQHGNVLGRPGAPVRLVEYGDLQCPICRTFALDTLPTIVQDYVRTGDVKIEFRGLAFIGSDSRKALQVVVAAGAQNRAWNLIDLLYRNQGQENSGWLTESLILAAASHVGGLDLDRLLSARGSAATAQRIRAYATQAARDMGGQLRTPTFLVGRAGQPLQLLQITSLDASQFTPALDRLLGR